MSDVQFQGKHYPIRDDESVLDALIRGGADIRFSCRKGSCHTCLLQCRKGEPGSQSRTQLSPELRQAGAFLPCLAHRTGDLEVEPLDVKACLQTAIVSKKEICPGGIIRLSLELALQTDWRAGQVIHLANPEGATRPYSLASIPNQDYFMELHIQHYPMGDVSGWVFDTLQEGDEVQFSGPSGACYYQPELKERPLIFIATGTGAGAMLAVARDALAAGHEGPVSFYHGVRNAERLYLQKELKKLARQHSHFSFRCAASGETGGQDVYAGRVTDIAFNEQSELNSSALFLCGHPEMVFQARYQAIGLGVERHRIFADPFEVNLSTDAAPVPRDKQKLHELGPELELWHALGEGACLNEILLDFYTRVYEDARLTPFFSRVTKERAIQKQYEFLRDIFSGTRDYFGLRPFNAHCWMVITDELFDYRERLFFESVARFITLPPALLRRWAAIDELFRREIVKSQERGLYIDGEQQPAAGFEHLTLSVGCVCDGCQSEIALGESGFIHQRTGELFCKGCSRRSSPPPVGG